MSESNGALATCFEQVPIGAVASSVDRTEEPKPGVAYRQVGVRLWGEGAYERETIDGSETKYRALNRTAAGDIIVNKIWARNGSVSVVQENTADCYCSGEFPLFSPDRDHLDPRWFYWATKTRWFWHRCDIQSRGTSGKNRIRPEKFLAITIPLPPLAEQRRIVAKIERLAGKIKEARVLQRECTLAASAFRLSSIAHAFDCTSAHWKTFQIGDLLEEDCYGTSEKAHVEPEGIPVLRMGNIQDGVLATSDLRYLHIADRDRAKWILRSGDILVNRTNSAELVGKCAVFDLDGDWSFASYLIRLRVHRDRVLPRLLAHYINSPRGRAYMFREKKQMTGQANVNAKTIRAMPITLPPLDEQKSLLHRIENSICRARSLEAEQRQAVRSSIALLPSVLDRAFRGEL